MDDRQLLEAAARDEALARRVAHILGPYSAAAEALAELAAERAQGRKAAIVLQGETWVVVRAAASRAKGV